MTIVLTVQDIFRIAGAVVIVIVGLIGVSLETRCAKKDAKEDESNE